EEVMNKRIFDVLGALVLLVIVLPFTPFIVAWIKATSPGPIIFWQERVGYRGKSFTIFKFRTMRHQSGGRAIDIVRSGDDRITAAGRFLRKTHIDELPQLINVLLGQMSLIGPRPHSLALFEDRVRRVPRYALRFEVLPGLTGLAQLYGREWSLSRGPHCTLRLELFYIKHRCIWMDIYILSRTVGVVLRGEGV
ncbi:MAG: sugar transferase, partial [bacterium]|nr:sugar transferase [bacterium]